MQTPWFIPRIGTAFLIFLVLVSLGSCVLLPSNKVIIWTDRPEFALYAEYFNNSQDKYKAEIRYFESPAQKLTEAGDYPDIVAASWLKSVSLRGFFKVLDSVFSKDGLAESAFYSRLLSMGKIDKYQYLIPVSFNIPAAVFAQNYTRSLSNPFTIEMEELKMRSQAFNSVTNGVYTKMGFSLSSNEEFLFIATILLGASFREASPVAWDSQALENSILWLKKWIAEANTSVQTEDDFAFKYFYEPPDKLVNSGRILCTCMDSSRLFTLPEERRMNLDFRWISAKEIIPLDEWNVFYGIHKKTRAFKAAKAFTRWFFTDETQRLLLEAARSKRLNETSFGISGGFSAMRTVTEHVFPQFYPDLLGRMPPESYLSPGNTLPRNWMAIKGRVILPYIRERIRYANRDEVRSLERRLSDWYRLNRD